MKIKYIKEQGYWYGNKGKLSVSDELIMFANTEEKEYYFLWVCYTDPDVRIWNTSNDPI